MTESDLMTLPISPRVFWGLVWMLGLLTACVVIYFARAASRQGDTAWFNTATFVNSAAGVVCTIFGIPLAAGFAYVLYLVFSNLPPSTEAEALALRMLLITMTALVASLGAVVAFPFTILRTRYNKRQTDAAEKALVNDKLNAAFAGLSARRTVTSRSRDVVYMLNNTKCITYETLKKECELPKGATLVRREPWQVISEEEDDIVTRSTAIDRLEGLAVEEPDQVDRIVSILSLYVRELSCEYPAEKMPDGMQEVDDIRKWAQALEVKRPDMQKAAQTLGRLPTLVDKYDPEQIKPDLRSSNLQAFDLNGLYFEHALMGNAQMQGANLSFAKMQGADLSFAEMQGANLTTATLRGAVVRFADFTNVALTGQQWKDVLGDTTTVLPEGTSYPDHWPTFEMDWEDFNREWTRFKQNPDAYTPPDPPKDGPET